ncbi:hypothetical protein B484DRAFT_316672, partial [Ochromonadaceae sp. CCMP2298]
YTYDKPVLVSRIIPPLGPISGNISITVLGGPFRNTDEIRCKFGRIAVRAFYLSEGKIQCYAPPHPGGVYPMEVTIN